MRSQGKPQALATAQGNGDDFQEIPFVGGQALQRVQTQYVTAQMVQVKRDIKAVELAICTEFEMGGEEMFYGWEVNDKNSDTGKSWIEGTSIEGAMVLVRNFGNSNVTIAPVDEGPTHWTLSATFIDLETGFTVNRLFRQRKPRESKYENDRALDIAFQVGQSKAMRNVVLQAMPGWLKKKANASAHQGAEKVVDADPEIALKNTFAAYELAGVPREAIAWKMGKPIAKFEKSDIVKVRALYRGIIDKVTSVIAEFGEWFELEAKAKAAAESAATPAQATPPPADPVAADGMPTSPTPGATSPTATADPAKDTKGAKKSTTAREPGDD